MAIKMKPSPGPWKQKGPDVFSKTGEGVCVPYALSNRDMANAQLIAAAPQLLKALKAIVKRCGCFDVEKCPECRRARRVIVKAEGTNK